MAVADFSKIKVGNDQKLTIQVDRFNGGVNTLLSAPRLKPNECVEARNLMLVEDGLWTKRWGTDYYGGALAGSKVDGFVEYRKSDGTRELIAFSGGLAQRKNGETWTTISGYTPTAETPVYSLQIGNKLYCCNGVDALAKYDGSTFATYTALDVPTNLALARTVLTTGNYNNYVQVSAVNEVGETVACTEVACSTNKQRGTWLSTEYITWTWTKVTNALRYKVYLGDALGYTFQVAEIEQSDTPTWKDDGNDTYNSYVYPVSIDTTVGPKFKYMTISDNRLWGCGGPDNPWAVYWSCPITSIYTEASFTSTSGGGWLELERGSKTITSGIIDFQGRPAIFCPTPDGRGAIWQVSLTTTAPPTSNSAALTTPTLTKITNQISSTAPRAIVQAENDVFFPTKRGIFLLGNEPGVTSTSLRTNELSARIRDYITAMTDDELTSMCSYYKEGKIFFAINDRMFYYDRERLCWVKDWSVGFSQLGDYTDTDGITHFLGAGSDSAYLYKISANYIGDISQPFNTSYLSPHIQISKDWIKFAKITKAYINLGQPIGSITLEILGIGKSTNFVTVASRTITPGISSSGMGWDRMGDVMIGDTDGSATTYAQASTIRYMKVNKLLREIQFHITTNTIDSQYTLLGLRAEGFPVQTSLPSSYKLNI